jgi:hypothetical protein
VGIECFEDERPVAQHVGKIVPAVRGVVGDVVDLADVVGAVPLVAIMSFSGRLRASAMASGAVTTGFGSGARSE